MKLLLDEMWPPAIAEQLRRRGYDVIAVQEREYAPRYAGLPDPDLLALAQEDGRTVVTDNIADFAPLASAYETRGEPYFGVIFAPSGRFDRSEPGVVGAIVRSLSGFIRSLAPGDEPFGRAHYLERI